MAPKLAFIQYWIAFHSDLKTTPDGPYIYTKNAIFGLGFGTE